MSTLSEITYKDFGKLRFLDFFPKTEEYVEDHEGGLESGIGLACYEGYRIFTSFASPVDSRWETSEITFDFENGCPETHANALMQHLGLPTRKGWTRNLFPLGLPPARISAKGSQPSGLPFSSVPAGASGLSAEQHFVQPNSAGHSFTFSAYP